MSPPQSYKEGETKLIFTDKNGLATAEQISLIGLQGFTLTGPRSHNQSIVQGLSSTHRFNLTETNKIKNNDSLLNNKSNHQKTIVMQKLDNPRDNASYLAANLYQKIADEEAEIPDEQIGSFCDFMHSLKESGYYDFEDMFEGTKTSAFGKSPIFYNYLNKCSKNS